MASGNGLPKMMELGGRGGKPQPNSELLESLLHPAWLVFVGYCRELGFGEIESLKIQDGLPVLAEVTRRKVKFT